MVILADDLARPQSLLPRTTRPPRKPPVPRGPARASSPPTCPGATRALRDRDSAAHDGGAARARSQHAMCSLAAHGRRGSPAPITPHRHAERRRSSSRPGADRFDLGRDAFVQRVAQFVTRPAARSQSAQSTVRADWTLHVLSPELPAVETFDGCTRTAGVQGHRVIHWCRAGHLAVDEEAEFTRRTASSAVSAADDPRSIVVDHAPRDMLGDAGQSDDERYQALIAGGATAQRRRIRSSERYRSIAVRAR